MSDPPETDLDYYSRPENYTGSNLQSLQKFTYAKQKQDKAQNDLNKKAKKKKSGFDLFARYKHILKGYVSDEEEEEDEEEDKGVEDEKEDSSKKSKFEEIKEECDETDKSVEEKKDTKKTDQSVQLVEEIKPKSPASESRRRSTDTTSPFPFGPESTPSPRGSITSASSVPPKPRGQPDASGGRSSVSLRFTKQQQIAKELQTKAVSAMYFISSA